MFCMLYHSDMFVCVVSEEKLRHLGYTYFNRSTVIGCIAVMVQVGKYALRKQLYVAFIDLAVRDFINSDPLSMFPALFYFLECTDVN